MTGPHPFREIQPGFERLPVSHVLPRHAHLAAYATVVLDGAYDQASYAGRLRLRPGDVLVQPTLDRHACWMGAGPGLTLLRLPWRLDPGFGGIWRPRRLDEVIAAARRDPVEAADLLAEHCRDAARPRRLADWPDLLSRDLTAGRASRLGLWASEHGLARETVSRGFAQAFGVGPHRYAAELRARRAWFRVLDGADSLAAIAAELGFADQPHMTRAMVAFTGAPPRAWRRAGRAPANP